MEWKESLQLVAFGVFSIWADDLFWLMVHSCKGWCGRRLKKDDKTE